MQRALMRRKKKKTRWGLLFILTIAVCAGVIVLQYQEAVQEAWREVRRVIWRPDVAAVLHALKREAVGIYCAGAEASCYVFDHEGVVFGAAQTVVGTGIVKIEDQSDFKPAMNAPLLDAEAWYNLSRIIGAVKNNELDAGSIMLNRADHEATVMLLPERIPVYFSLAFDPQAHVDALPELRKKISLSGLQYIDMRVEGKIFYK